LYFPAGALKYNNRLYYPQICLNKEDIVEIPESFTEVKFGTIEDIRTRKYPYSHSATQLYCNPGPEGILIDFIQKQFTGDYTQKSLEIFNQDFCDVVDVVAWVNGTTNNTLYNVVPTIEVNELFNIRTEEKEKIEIPATIAKIFGKRVIGTNNKIYYSGLTNASAQYTNSSSTQWATVFYFDSESSEAHDDIDMDHNTCDGQIAGTVDGEPFYIDFYSEVAVDVEAWEKFGTTVTTACYFANGILTNTDKIRVIIHKGEGASVYCVAIAPNTSIEFSYNASEHRGADGEWFSCDNQYNTIDINQYKTIYSYANATPVDFSYGVNNDQIATLTEGGYLSTQDKAKLLSFEDPDFAYSGIKETTNKFIGFNNFYQYPAYDQDNYGKWISILHFDIQTGLEKLDWYGSGFMSAKISGVIKNEQIAIPFGAKIYAEGKHSFSGYLGEEFDTISNCPHRHYIKLYLPEEAAQDCLRFSYYDNSEDEDSVLTSDFLNCGYVMEIAAGWSIEFAYEQTSDIESDDIYMPVTVFEYPLPEEEYYFEFGGDRKQLTDHQNCSCLSKYNYLLAQQSYLNLENSGDTADSPVVIFTGTLTVHWDEEDGGPNGYDNCELDCTFEDIIAACDAGKTVCLACSHDEVGEVRYFNLVNRCEESWCDFTYVLGNTIERIHIESDNSCSISTTTSASSGDGSSEVKIFNITFDAEDSQLWKLVNSTYDDISAAIANNQLVCLYNDYGGNGDGRFYYYQGWTPDDYYHFDNMSWNEEFSIGADEIILTEHVIVSASPKVVIGHIGYTEEDDYTEPHLISPTAEELNDAAYEGKHVVLIEDAIGDILCYNLISNYGGDMTFSRADVNGIVYITVTPGGALTCSTMPLPPAPGTSTAALRMLVADAEGNMSWMEIERAEDVSV